MFSEKEWTTLSPDNQAQYETTIPADLSHQVLRKLQDSGSGDN
jgi:hypothetical protein